MPAINLRLFIALFLTFFIAEQAAAEDPHWGDFRKDHCTEIGVRQYSAVLWGIPWGTSWENACATTHATVQEKFFPTPTRCKNAGGQMWGEFEVPDDHCPFWGAVNDGACDTSGCHRRIAWAFLRDIPKGMEWDYACNKQAYFTPDGRKLAASKCVKHEPEIAGQKTGIAEKGEFYVEDSTCPCASATTTTTTTSTLKPGEKEDPNKKQKESCHQKCDDSPIGKSLQGAALNDPDKTGSKAAIVILACHGACEILAYPDLSTMHYNEDLAVPKGCLDSASRIYDIPCTDAKGTWASDYDRCKSIDSYKGQKLTSALKQITGGINTFAWATFAIADSTCNAKWGDFKRDNCVQEVGYRQYSAILWNIPPGINWLDACNSAPATINGQSFAKPARCKEAGGHVWGEFDVVDEICGGVAPTPRPAPAVTQVPSDPIPTTTSNTTTIPNVAKPKVPTPGKSVVPNPTAQPTVVGNPPATQPPVVTGQSYRTPTAQCDPVKVSLCKSLLQDQVPWTVEHAHDPAFRHWQEGNLDKLCTCTADPAKAVQCFQDELVRNGNSWEAAIKVCRTR